MSPARKHLALGIAGALLLTAAPASAQVPSPPADEPIDDVAPSRTASGPARSLVEEDDAPADAARDETDKDEAPPSSGVRAGPLPSVFVAPVVDAPVEPERLAFSVDVNAVRAGGWLLTIVGLGAVLTGIAAPLASEPSHHAHGAERSMFPGWATPLAIGGGVAMTGGLVIVAACGPVGPDKSVVHESSARGLGLGYRGTF